MTNTTVGTVVPETLPASAIPTVLGTAFEGGFYYGRVRINGDLYALVVAPKELGEFQAAAWGEYGKLISGAKSVIDGLQNTLDMAAADLILAKKALALVINGKTDWYLPARDELEVLYRALKPTDEENACWWRDGENSNAVPPTDAYTPESPAQTESAAFKDGGAEALCDGWYWTSTQRSAYDAVYQDFGSGYQYDDGKDSKRRARAVRRIKIL